MAINHIIRTSDLEKFLENPDKNSPVMTMLQRIYNESTDSNNPDEIMLVNRNDCAASIIYSDDDLKALLETHRIPVTHDNLYKLRALARESLQSTDTHASMLEILLEDL